MITKKFVVYNIVSLVTLHLRTDSTKGTDRTDRLDVR